MIRLVLWLSLLVAACAGTTGGIHARMAYSEDGGLRVIDVPEGPAFAAGLAPGDVIFAIDEEPLAGLTMREIVEKLRGPVGSRVKLDVVRDGERREIEVERSEYAGR